MKIDQFTIVILTRNHEDFIQDCLQSVFRELSEANVLFADIGSVDKSFTQGKEIAKKLNLKSTHIQFNENTRTLTVLKALEGYIDSKYIILLSADDALGENYRNSLLQIFEKSPEYKVINFISLLTDQDLNPLYFKHPKWTYKITENKRSLSYSNPGTAPGAVIPWEILIKTPTWKQPPDIIIEDYWIWWQLIEQVPFVICDDAYVLYRQHQNNISKNTKDPAYAYSLGYVTALPNIKATNIFHTILSCFLIVRWVRHLSVLVWKEFYIGYKFAKRNVAV
jgi:glycosyltransferase involved in cell wall biosynthesis